MCAFEVLEHIEDDATTLKEWAARLRPGGWLLLSVPAHQHRYAPADELAGHFRRYDPAGMTALLASCGFTEIKIRQYGFPLGYLLEAGRNQIARRRLAASAGQSLAERTAGSGRLLQPSGGSDGCGHPVGNGAVPGAAAGVPGHRDRARGSGPACGLAAERRHPRLIGTWDLPTRMTLRPSSPTGAAVSRCCCSAARHARRSAADTCVRTSQIRLHGRCRAGPGPARAPRRRLRGPGCVRRQCAAGPGSMPRTLQYRGIGSAGRVPDRPVVSESPVAVQVHQDHVAASRVRGDVAGLIAHVLVRDHVTSHVRVGREGECRQAQRGQRGGGHAPEPRPQQRAHPDHADRGHNGSDRKQERRGPEVEERVFLQRGEREHLRPQRDDRDRRRRPASRIMVMSPATTSGMASHTGPRPKSGTDALELRGHEGESACSPRPTGT